MQILPFILERKEHAEPPGTVWTPGPERPILRPDEVHVWRAHLDELECPAPDVDILPLAELVRAEHLAAVPQEQARYLAFRVFLRTVLSRYVGETVPANLRWEELNASSRCRLAGSTLYFDHSRADELALLAVSPQPEFGLDMERVRTDLPFEEMAGHFFEPAEQWIVRTTLTTGQKARKFFDVWTSSEARLKVNPTQCAQLQRRLALHRLAPAEDVLAALATTADGDRMRLACWDWHKDKNGTEQTG